jgi:hypothetical protein
MDEIYRNTHRHITRFVHPDGLVTIFPLDATLEEANALGPMMEAITTRVRCALLVTNAFSSAHLLARLN